MLAVTAQDRVVEGEGISVGVRGVALIMATSSIFWSSGCAPYYSGVAPVIAPKDTPESRIGERIFREPRFSKFFVHNTRGNPNGKLSQGDPTLTQSESARRGRLNGPFNGQAMSCVACHMVDDAVNVNRGGMRGYADFSPRSPIPHLSEDSLTVTPRNSPTLINAFIDRPGPLLLHFDGEFASIEDLVIGSYSGRNFGWLPGERSQAIANLVNVFRMDDGSDPLAAKFGGGTSYRELLMGQNPAIPKDIVIPEESRINTATADDQAILDRAVSFVKIYLLALQFARDPVTNVYTGSPYDHFLLVNALPQLPESGETDIQYAGRLAWALQGLGKPKFVHDDSGDFDTKELDGLRIFLATSKTPSPQRPGYFQVGNCVACHAPPNFTDFRFHNTGASQEEYDSIHGVGSFVQLKIPTLAERLAQPDHYLPGNDLHPNGTGVFRSPPSARNALAADLGAWNIFLNPDYPAPQAPLAEIFCGHSDCGEIEQKNAALVLSTATFKTPGLRGLDLSDPYMHNGRMQTIGDVLRFYQKSSDLQRAGRLRNGDPELSTLQIDATGVESVSAFLKSLNEEYE